MPSGYDNLDLIASKPTSHISPADVLGSQILGKFFDWARKNYERVIIDSAPFGLVSDALALGMLSDSVIIVCRPERSRYGVVRHALRSLSESGSRILGIVVNALFTIGRYNDLATRPVPNFFRREGANNARS